MAFMIQDLEFGEAVRNEPTFSIGTNSSQDDGQITEPASDFEAVLHAERVACVEEGQSDTPWPGSDGASHEYPIAIPEIDATADADYDEAGSNNAMHAEKDADIERFVRPKSAGGMPGTNFTYTTAKKPRLDFQGTRKGRTLNTPSVGDEMPENAVARAAENLNQHAEVTGVPMPPGTGTEKVKTKKSMTKHRSSKQQLEVTCQREVNDQDVISPREELQRVPIVAVEDLPDRHPEDLHASTLQDVLQQCNGTSGGARVSIITEASSDSRHVYTQNETDAPLHDAILETEQMTQQSAGPAERDVQPSRSPQLSNSSRPDTREKEDDVRKGQRSVSDVHHNTRISKVRSKRSRASPPKAEASVTQANGPSGEIYDYLNILFHKFQETEKSNSLQAEREQEREAELRAAINDKHRYEAQVYEVVQERDDLQRYIDNEIKPKIANWQKFLSGLANDQEPMRQMKKKLDSDCEAVIQGLGELKAERNQMFADVKKLEIAADSLKGDAGKARKEMSVQLENFTQDRTYLQQQLDRLAGELAEKRTQCVQLQNDLSQRLAATAESQETIIKMLKLNEEMTLGEVAKLQESFQHEHNGGHVTSLVQQLNEAVDCMRSASDESLGSRTCTDDLIRQLSESIARQLSDTTSTREIDLSAFRGCLEKSFSAIKSDLRDRDRQLRQDIVAEERDKGLEARITEYDNHLTAAKSEVAQARVNEKTLQDEVVELRGKLGQLQNASTTGEQAYNQVIELKAEVDNKVRLIDSITMDLSRKDDELASVNTSHEHLQQQVDTLQACNKELQTAKANLTTERETLQKQTDTADERSRQERIALAQQVREELKTQYANEAKRIRSERDHLQRHSKQLEQDLAHCRAQLAEQPQPGDASSIAIDHPDAGNGTSERAGETRAFLLAQIESLRNDLNDARALQGRSDAALEQCQVESKDRESALEKKIDELHSVTKRAEATQEQETKVRDEAFAKERTSWEQQVDDLKRRITDTEHELQQEKTGAIDFHQEVQQGFLQQSQQFESRQAQLMEAYATVTSERDEALKMLTAKEAELGDTLQRLNAAEGRGSNVFRPDDELQQQPQTTSNRQLQPPPIIATRSNTIRRETNADDSQFASFTHLAGKNDHQMRAPILVPNSSADLSDEMLDCVEEIIQATPAATQELQLRRNSNVVGAISALDAGSDAARPSLQAPPQGRSLREPVHRLESRQHDINQDRTMERSTAFSTLSEHSSLQGEQGPSVGRDKRQLSSLLSDAHTEEQQKAYPRPNSGSKRVPAIHEVSASPSRGSTKTIRHKHEKRSRNDEGFRSKKRPASMVRLSSSASGKSTSTAFIDERSHGRRLNTYHTTNRVDGDRHAAKVATSPAIDPRPQAKKGAHAKKRKAGGEIEVGYEQERKKRLNKLSQPTGLSAASPLSSRPPSRPSKTVHQTLSSSQITTTHAAARPGPTKLNGGRSTPRHRPMTRSRSNQYSDFFAEQLSR